MTDPVSVTFIQTDIERLAQAEGRVAVIVPPDGRMGQAARRLNRLTRGALARLLESDAWAKIQPGKVVTLEWPTGLKAQALDVLCLPRGADSVLARNGGVALGARLTETGLLLAADATRRPSEVAFGVALRAYGFSERRGAIARSEIKVPGPVTAMVRNPDEATAAYAPRAALAEGVFLTRDLVNEPQIT